MHSREGQGRGESRQRLPEMQEVRGVQVDGAGLGGQGVHACQLVGGCG